MSLSKYNKKYIPELFGLQNNGVSSLCYLNSLIQALMSCSSVNEHILNNLDYYKACDCKIAIEYANLYKRHCNPSKQTKINISNVSKIQALLHELSGNNILIDRQECLNEAFIFLIESIKDLKKLFHIRYNLYMNCRKCNSNSENPNIVNMNPPELWINLSEESSLLCKNLNTKNAIEKYIMTTILWPDDYVCEKCGVKNDQRNLNIYQEYKLHMLSEVLIIIFPSKVNVYSRGKEILYFPPELDFPAITGNLHYELVSQVEHYGTNSGGHWTTKCSRPRATFVDNILKEKEEYITTEVSNIHNKQIKKQYMKKLTALQSYILKNDEKIVFNFNDYQVSVSNFIPTANTYMVFYHLQ